MSKQKYCSPLIRLNIFRTFFLLVVRAFSSKALTLMLIAKLMSNGVCRVHVIYGKDDFFRRIFFLLRVLNSEITDRIIFRAPNVQVVF